MPKLTKDFFPDNEVLFIGYAGNASKNRMFCRTVYRALINNGINVIPMNDRAGGQYDIKVYASLDQLPKVPACAYILLKNDNAKKILKPLKEKGVKRVLFQSAKTADQEVLAECRKLGLETTVACPMMTFGGGIHKIHAFFAGRK